MRVATSLLSWPRPSLLSERGQAIDYETGYPRAGLRAAAGRAADQLGCAVGGRTGYGILRAIQHVPLGGTADPKLAMAAEAEARKILGMRSSDIRPSVRPWVGWPGRRATSQVEAV